MTKTKKAQKITKRSKLQQSRSHPEKPMTREQKRIEQVRIIKEAREESISSLDKIHTAELKKHEEELHREVLNKEARREAELDAAELEKLVEKVYSRKGSKRRIWVLTFPIVILEDKKLKPLDRLLLGFIIALDSTKGCYATNKVLAKLVGCSVSAVSKSISKMLFYKYILTNEENIRGNGGYTRRVAPALKAHKI